MAEFINTVDVLGDDAVMDSIIDRSITEFCDDIITKIGANAFRGCNSLVTVKVPSAKTVCEDAFSGCKSLAYVDMSGAENIPNRAFASCQALVEVHADQATYIYDWAFTSCTALKKVIFPNAETLGGNALNGCTALEYVDLPNTTLFWASIFSGTALSTLILRTTLKVCTLKNVDAFYKTPIAQSTGYIYVPRALVDSYKTASNWSTFAAQFRALEDYTVDGTTTGELDETKI